MRRKFAILLAIAAVCVTTAWAGWTSESLVTGSSGMWRQFFYNNTHAVVFGTDRVGHLVWTGGPANQSGNGVWYNRYNPGSGGRPGSWAADFAIAPYSTKSKVSHGGPCVALDGDGRTIHVVWTSFPAGPGSGVDTLCYRRCTQDKRGNDKWDATLRLYAAKSIDWPVVACVPNEPNHVLVCWRYTVDIQGGGSSRVVRLREYVNGAWTEAVRLDSSTTNVSGSTAIAAASNGDVFVAYPGYDDGTTVQQIFVKTRHDGVWGPPVNVTQNLPCLRNSIHTTLEVDPITCNPHVVFERWMEVPNGEGPDTVTAVYHTYRTASGDWLTPEAISEPHDALFGLHVPTMAFLSNGAAHVVWRDTVLPTNSGIMHSYCSSEGGTWSAPELLVSYHSNTAFIAAEEPAHAIRVVWQRQFAGRDEIWWKSNFQGGGGSQAEPMAMSQSGIELFPNPARAGRVTVQYSLPRAEPMSVTLLDVSGRAVRTQEVVVGVRGSFALDVRGLRAGVYILKLESGTSSLTRKLVIR